MIVTSKYYRQTVFILTLVNPPPPSLPPQKKIKKSQVANEQKNRSVMRGSSGAGKVILGQRVRKVRENRVR